jgi:hypothetical protein
LPKAKTLTNTLPYLSLPLGVARVLRLLGLLLMATTFILGFKMTASRTFRGILGEVLKEYRLEKGMTLRDISEKSSVALGYVSELERGHKEASSEILDNLAYGLDVPLYQIIIEVGYRLADWDTPQRILDNELDKELSGV